MLKLLSLMEERLGYGVMGSCDNCIINLLGMISYIKYYSRILRLLYPNPYLNSLIIINTCLIERQRRRRPYRQKWRGRNKLNDSRWRGVTSPRTNSFSNHRNRELQTKGKIAKVQYPSKHRISYNNQTELVVSTFKSKTDFTEATCPRSWVCLPLNHAVLDFDTDSLI